MPRPYSLLTTEDYISYFETIAKQATFLDTFYYGYAAASDGGKKNRGGAVLVLEPYSNNITDSNADNVEGVRRGMFIVIKQAKSILDYPVVQNECEKLVYKIIGKIRRDSRAHILRAEISGWNGFEAGPVFSQYVGYGVEFSFRAPINRFLVAEDGDWEET